jgi:hypothetical protein
MSVASLLILIGGTGRLRPGFLIAGGVLAAAVLAAALYLAIRSSGDPSQVRARWALAGVALFYAALAAAAGVAGASYAIAALAAGVIPLSAIALLVATARSKTADGHHEGRDASAADGDDPYPGVGLDEGTGLGESPEHSVAVNDRH